VFSAIASVAFENSGRGAIVVDTTSQAMPGAGHPFGYFSQEQIEELGDEDTSRMVTEYEPAQERASPRQNWSSSRPTWRR
jgi:hypothetical protein